MQDVEAMLCAYIEGDLDEAGRAEIEKHLAEHPQHRKLLEELMITRDLLKELPRVKATMDVDDSLRGQVERSILLDDSRIVEESQTRPSRLPRLLAMAAMILLCSALGLIVYSTLGPTSKPATYTQVTPQAQQLGTRALSPMTDEAKDMIAESAPTSAVAAIPPAAAPALDQAALTPQMQQAPMTVQAPSPNEIPATVLVVHSDNPSAAMDQIGQYLRGQAGWKWQFEPTPQGQNAATNMNFMANNLANATSNFASQIQVAPATTMPSIDSATTLPTETDQAPPVPPSVLVDKPEYWVHQMSAEQFAALRESLRDQFNAPADEYSASISAPALGLPLNIAPALALDGRTSTEPSGADDLVMRDRRMAAPASGGFGGGGGGGRGGGGGFGGGGGGGGGGGFGTAIGGAAAKEDIAAAELPATQSALADAEKSAPGNTGNLLDAIIVVEPMTPAASAVESPATMPATLPSDTAMPATQPGN